MALPRTKTLVVSRDCFEHNPPHDRFYSDGAHELCAHQHENSKDRPVVMRQSQDLSTKQGEQTRQTHFDPIAYP